MLLIRASEYALLSLDAIPQNRKNLLEQNSLQVSLISPKSFLAKIMQNLAKEGILESRKGAQGGFILAKKLEEITLYSIIVAAEGKPPAVLDCTLYIGFMPKRKHRDMFYLSVFVSISKQN